MTTEPQITIRRLRPELLDDYLTFFEERAFADNPEWAGCYCYFPYHAHETSDFDERTPAANREAISQAVRSGQATGYLAYYGAEVVGWVNAAPRDRYPQLSRFPGDGTTTGATPCFTIDPEWRGRGIAGRLLRAAIEGLEAEGMVRMEAGPMAEPKTPADRFKGTVELYRAAGYEEVADLPGGTRLMERKL